MSEPRKEVQPGVLARLLSELLSELRHGLDDMHQLKRWVARSGVLLAAYELLSAASQVCDGAELADVVRQVEEAAAAAVANA